MFLPRLLVPLCALLLPAIALPGPARAEGKSIIVLDASGSMWGQIDGRAKLEIARDALGTVLTGLPADTEIGLMAYGHRTKGDCSDIELVVPPAAGTADAIIAAARGMTFLGKTPLSDAVRQAAGDLKSTEDKATVILITDGIETCNADPCALGTELEASGVDFTAHVVGFGLTAEEGRAVACLAENTGGQYIEAKDAGQLEAALKTTVAEVAPEPAPAPEPEPEPATLDRNIDPVIQLAAGQDEPEIAEDAAFAFYPMTDAGPAKEYTATLYGTGSDLLPPGRYWMTTELHDASAAQEIEVTATDLARPVVVLDAGILNLTVLANAGGDPDDDGFFRVDGADDVTESGYARAFRVLPAGEYALLTELGAAKTTQTIVIEAGKVLDKEVVMGVGLATVEAFYTDSLPVEGGDHFVEVLSATQDLDGERESFGYSYGTGARFDLPPGDYLIRASLGAAMAEQPVTVTAGERVDVKLVLNAGVAAFTSPTDDYIEVLAAKADINGDRASIIHGFGPAWQTTLAAGDYVVKTSKDGSHTEAPFTVTAGERLEMAVTSTAP